MTTKSKGSISSDLRTQMGCLRINNKRYPLYEGVNTIGRNVDATVTVRDPSVSQRHALITIINENQHFVSDLHSFNGTIVEHNILNPMLLYELSQDTVINFANCKAIYEKVPGDSQSIAHRNSNGHVINTTLHSQRLSESFYSGPTQAFENDPTPTATDLEVPTCNYFEDDYNFADIPSPPMHQTNQENKSTLASVSDKSGLSIHEMPTQLYCSEVVSHVVVGDSQTPASSNLDCQVIAKVDVHELPTQIFCSEVAANESVDKTQSEAAIHDMPTQIIGNVSNSKEKSAPFDGTNANIESKSLCDDTVDDIQQCESKANNSKIADTSLDIIDETHLDDSGLDVTAQSLQSNKSGGSSMPAILESRSNTQSPLHVSQLHCKSPKSIAEDNIDSSGSEVIKNNLRKQCKPISELEESSSEEIGKQKKKCHVLDSDNSDTDIEDLQDSVKANTSKLVKESSATSLSEVSKTNNKTKQKNTSKNNSSGSDTEIEDEIQDKASTSLESNVKMKTITERKTLKNKKQNKTLNYSDSDTDAEDFEFGVKNKVNKENTAQNLNTSSKLDETDVIPGTQISKDDDDDDDDFNFIPEITSTLVSKRSSDQPQERIFDVSQKLKELREKCVVPQNCSEESFHLRLSELEGSEAAKHPDKIEDDDNTPDISDVDEPLAESEDIGKKKIAVDKKVNEGNTQDIFEMATQKLSEDVLIRKEEKDEIFAKPTTSKCFSKMKKQSESQSDRAKHSQDADDDLFMQPTQPVLAKSVRKEESASINDEDIFMQPTQVYEVHNQAVQSKPVQSDEIEDDIFMQPTQQVVADPLPLFRHKPVASDKNQPNDDIFMQPTQLLETEPATANKKHCSDNIFEQPTQLIEVVEPKKHNKPNNDDIFMQPTQEVVSISNDAVANKPLVGSVKTQPDEDIFMQPTQVVSVAAPSVTKLPNESIFQKSTQPGEVSAPKDDTKHDNDDLFMQATQKITLSDVPSNKSDSNSVKVPQTPQKHSLSLHKKSMERNEFDDVESQLEVMFASQTLRISSQKNSRPANPLVNVLDEKPVVNSEPISEEPAAEVDDTSKNENVKSPESGSSLSSSDDLKEYCARSTLPIDELIDFSTTPRRDEQNKTKGRGRPAKRTSPAQEANVSGTPRKRGRPFKSELPETTLDSARKSKRTRKIIDGGKAIVGVVSESKQGLEKVLETKKKQSLELKPSPGPSTSGIRNQTEDESVLKNKTATSCEDEDKEEVNEKDTERMDALTDSDDELKPVRKNFKQKVTSSRVTRKNNPDEGNSKNKDTIKKKNTRDDDGDNAEKNKETSKSTASTSRVGDADIINIQNSESDEEEDKPEIIKNRTRTQTKTNLKKPLYTNKRTTRTNVAEAMEETVENEIKPENTRNDTNKRKMRSKAQDKPPTTLNEVEESTATESRRSRRNKVVETVQIIPPSSDNSETRSERSNTPTPSTVTRRKVNNKTEVQENDAESKISQAEASSSTLSRRESSTNGDTNKKQTPVGRRAQTRRQPANLEASDDECSSADMKSVSSNASGSVTTGKRSKRLLSKDSEAGKSKPLPKKLKNTEASEHDEVASNSDNSEISFQTPRRNISQLNVTSTPDRIRRIQKPKVVFTMLNSPQLESLVRRLGGMVVDTVSACTVLVTGSLKRSQKLLSAVGLGKPICSPKWLDACKKDNKFVDPWDYILEDEEAESKWNFTLKESLNRSQNQKLLQDFTIVLAVSEALDVLKAAIESCGGKCAMRIPPKNTESKLVIVANPSKKTSYSKFLKQKPPATVVAPEAIFDGVLRQEFHWEDHMLS